MPAISLLNKLGVLNHTKKHVSIINNFIKEVKNGNINISPENMEETAVTLLEELGSFDDIDMDITIRWIKKQIL